MKEVSLKNFRCFHERQTARLAPLTLLVGENSSGKTSFLALIRALRDLTEPLPPSPYAPSVFNTIPYDLGSFDEIAHHRGSRGSRANSFQVGYLATQPLTEQRIIGKHQIRWEFTFGKKATAPQMTAMRVSDRYNTCAEISRSLNNSGQVTFRTERGIWKLKSEILDRLIWNTGDRISLYFMSYFIKISRDNDPSYFRDIFIPSNDSSQLTDQDLRRIIRLADLVWNGAITGTVPHASAPVRSKPRRTYDPLPSVRDPEGGYIPMYFSNLANSEPDIWNTLKHDLQSFGNNSGLFDELSIRHLGHKKIEPFQMQIRKFGSKHKGPMRNIIDVGYGVSQVLPLITELLQADTASMFLIQQPEIHLHPSAQAALGSFFCQVANWKRQLVVETHSDYIIDRIRMDVRDKESTLSAEDVSILYFERDDLDSKIHCLQLDEHGNILGAPDSYRQFFMKETRRSLGI